MMMNWSPYRRELKEKIGQIAQVSPDVVKGYRAISDAGAKTAQLSPKTRELIALAEHWRQELKVVFRKRSGAAG